ncbi:MAG: phosphoribosylglycinamide formyltransferase [Candidatus Micrarchaeota archaeon]|nr:phosphoribosylglycinamide formyltransferase [Candidatus Micrarchaeota archaeon]
MTINLAVFASGRGSNFKAILDAIEEGKCDAKVLCLVTDNPAAAAINYAKEKNIPVLIFERKNYKTAIDFDNAILFELKKYPIDLIVLAGYMRIIRSKDFLNYYKNKIINIHPSLLPKYPGAHAQKDAFEAGEKISGLTIHIVNEILDGGPIIFQHKVDISDCKSAEEVANKILKYEHIYYPFIIDQIAKGKIVLSKF